ncbi:unnamed protein product [Fusarium graminearum]|uniref:Chromosome 3, complete genome n=1 Tax=Gibberella zeae (strain ATCC MYA-4620 / CBS 123657 / FGSC 9075 / NRRL 31084 / PH-1) TaxID=229533 RepID=I1S7B3_GIBZE|nr:hypothetical protein FGSG_12736 [Fusarium graminearum PH-1]ESU11380.1 hypothetical protein FGSG_12736 [Fusarium graminearum PH-1]EYB30209.1 hypothetical protein FG05_12736 [Fusarium graminearum]CEF87137.1 unnamed protein product [Fusarium graminearum]CZS84042.1 unnamed protein product [Fusarium graminearum]|eukprot:XP_011323956.1 hypothetical protein FGSG_12736 [Fusarium graminearum PH-1]
MPDTESDALETPSAFLYRARIDGPEEPGGDDNICTKPVNLSHERSPSQNSSSSHISRWLKPKRRKTTASTSTLTNWEALSGCKLAGVPDILHIEETFPAPRADLSDAFHHAQGRWNRDRSSSGKSTTVVSYSTTNDGKSSQTTQDDFEHELGPELSAHAVEKDPPQLAPLPDMSKCSLERSSTLRACIEKPSDDFIVEYKSQRRSSKKTIHYELTNRSRPYTAPPKALPAATLRPLERKTRIKSRHLPSNDMAVCSKDKRPSHWAPDSKARCRSLPKEEFQWASGTSVTAGSVVKHDSEQDSPSCSTSITTLQLPPNVFERPPLSEQNVHSLHLAALQSAPKPAIQRQLSNRFSSQGSNITFSSIGLGIC